MREIKVIAWSPLENRFVHDDEYFYITWDGGGPLKGFLAVEQGVDIFNDEDPMRFEDHECELLEYTGLKDKNGKEIYEGDIISVNGKPPVEVKWCGGAWGYQNVMWPEKSLVIGNIYESPELLEAVNNG